VLDYVKWQRRRQCDSLDDLGTIPSTDAPAREAVNSAALSELLAKLSSKQRHLLVLLLDGHTWREAAKELGCVSSNVAYHMRAIRKAYVEVMEGKKD
jgi:DNA-directed RNA polymerase specialized sigma24 family protein